MTHVFIIEDEIKTARYLSALVQATDGFTIAGMATSVEGAVEWLTNDKPGLIISDIQLGDGLSFEIFNKMPLRVPVIFCTAYDQYAIAAFEANGIDYLLKPIDSEKLQLSLQKFKSMHELFAPRSDYSERLDNALAGLTSGQKTTLLIHHRERIIPLKLEEVNYVQSENGVVTLYCNTARYHVNHTLEEMEHMLNPQQFFQVNRQFIVNRRFVNGAEHYFSRRLLVQMGVKTDADIIVSKARVQQFLIWLGNS